MIQILEFWKRWDLGVYHLFTYGDNKTRLSDLRTDHQQKIAVSAYLIEPLSLLKPKDETKTKPEIWKNCSKLH